MRGSLPDYQRFRRIVDLLQSLVDQKAASFAVERRDKPQGCPLPLAQVTADAQVKAVADGLRYAEGQPAGTCVLTRREDVLVLKLHPAAVASPEVQELCHWLGLMPGLLQYDVSVGELPPFPTTFPPEPLTRIDVSPRSTIEAMYYLSNGVAVPPEHLAAGVARTAAAPDGSVFDWREVTEGLFTVCYARGHKRPEHAYVAVRYRDYWFYIDDRDSISKSTFNLMLQFTRIDLGYPAGAARSQQPAPILTLPLGR